MRVSILPLGDVPRDALAALSDDLAGHGLACEVQPPVELPGAAWDAGRAQFDGDEVLRALPPRSNATLLAVTRQDLFSGAYTFVFGLADVGGARALVSLQRLEARDRGLSRRRFRKEAVHELGHSWGLSHCDDPGCVMAFSNRLEEVDGKGDEPCARCRALLPFAFAPVRRV